MDFIPWVEKYRPKKFEDVILEKCNESIFKTMIEKRYVTNILAYGFPGTGKTTTIMNFVAFLSKLQGDVNSSSIIHLNASDDRGIDVIRNQIQNFVNSKNIYSEKNPAKQHLERQKFVILDEVDYMTKSAQQYLKYLIQTSNKNVSFFLICNYISRIDNGLKNEFMKLPFHFMEFNKVVDLLEIICQNENIKYDRDSLLHLKTFYGNDIRSMINYLQSNHTTRMINYSEIYKTIFSNESESKICDKIEKLCIDYNIQEKYFIINFFHFLRNKDPTFFFQKNVLDFIEHLLHSKGITNSLFLKYSIFKIKKLKNLKI